jgi:hypothetical protein
MVINVLIKLKMKKNYNITFVLLAILVIFGCSKKNDNNAEVTGQLYFHLHTNVDTAEVDDYNTVIQSSDGRKISLSIAQLYISNIQLVKLDGSIYPVTCKILLKVLDNEVYFVGNVPAGNYNSVIFNIGLDSVTNSEKPLNTDTVLNRPEMWFSNVAQPQGYVYLNVEGKIDTSANADGSVAQMVPFAYKIGTQLNVKQVTMPVQHYSVLPNQTEYVHMIINYMKVFNGVDLSKPGNLSIKNISDNSGALANQIANNIPGMFSYEQ